jgi:hypothetical protein
MSAPRAAISLVPYGTSKASTDNQNSAYRANDAAVTTTVPGGWRVPDVCCMSFMPTDEETKAYRREKSRLWRLANPDKAREIVRRCYRKHRERMNLERRQARQRNPERAKEYQRRYYLKNIELMRAKGRAYAEKNKEKHRANARAWNKNNAEKCRVNLYKWRDENRPRLNELIRHYLHSKKGRFAASRASIKRRAKLKTIPKTLTMPEWQQILLEWNHSCAYCHRSNFKLTQDHVVPIMRGGHHTKENVVPACIFCNSRKRTKLIIPLKEFPLFRLE